MKRIIFFSLVFCGCATTPTQKFNLYSIAANGKTEEMTKALTSGADINAKSDDGTTPLMVAAFKDQPEMVKFLLANGAQAALSDQQQQTALHYASLARGASSCGILAMATPSVDLKDGSDLTPLMIAARFGLADCVRELIAAGASPNVADESGWTALYFAIPRGNKEIIEVLLNAKANLRHRDLKGYTPLHIAALYRLKEVYAQLVKHKAPQNLRDKEGKTPKELLGMVVEN